MFGHVCSKFPVLWGASMWLYLLVLIMFACVSCDLFYESVWFSLCAHAAPFLWQHPKVDFCLSPFMGWNWAQRSWRMCLWMNTQWVGWDPVCSLPSLFLGGGAGSNHCWCHALSLRMDPSLPHTLPVWWTPSPLVSVPLLCSFVFAIWHALHAIFWFCFCPFAFSHSCPGSLRESVSDWFLPTHNGAHDRIDVLGCDGGWYRVNIWHYELHLDLQWITSW